MRLLELLVILQMFHVENDISSLRIMCDNIQQLINYEENAAAKYDDCEQRVADRISQIRI